MGKNYVIGIDYGTDSVRTIIADALTGKEVSSSVIFIIPGGKIKNSASSSSQQYRQHPSDYIEGLEHTIKDCISLHQKM
jgi:L-ribulokinase